MLMRDLSFYFIFTRGFLSSRNEVRSYNGHLSIFKQVSQGIFSKIPADDSNGTTGLSRSHN